MMMGLPPRDVHIQYLCMWCAAVRMVDASLVALWRILGYGRVT
jgi:hypothetical protein